MWSKLEILYHIVKAGSLVNAAKVLNTDQPALSSKLAFLEKKFGFKLINRSTPHKPLTLTRKGEEVFRVAEQTFTLMQQLNTTLSSEDTLKGRVRLSTTHSIASFIIAPMLFEFSEQFPQIEVELLCNDTEIDIFSNEVDMVIRPYIDDDATLIQEPLFSMQTGLYASTEYLEKFGTPKTVQDLDKHRLLVYARPDQNTYADVNWALKVGREGRKARNPFYTANSTHILLSAAEAGLGITPFYELMKRGRQTNLVRVLEDVKGPEYTDYIAYPKNLEKTKKVQALRNFLVEKAIGKS